MLTEKEIREWLAVREELMESNIFEGVEDFYREQGFIEGLKYVLEE